MSRSLLHIVGLAVAATTLLAPSIARAEGPMSEASVVSPEEGTTQAGKLAAGLALLGAGSLAAIGGGVAYTAYSADTDPCAAATAGCSDPHKGGKNASIVALVLGSAGVAVGIPLIITSTDSDHGARKRKSRTAAFLPDVHLGAGSASLSWRF